MPPHAFLPLLNFAPVNNAAPASTKWKQPERKETRPDCTIGSGWLWRNCMRRKETLLLRLWKHRLTSLIWVWLVTATTACIHLTAEGDFKMATSDNFYCQKQNPAIYSRGDHHQIYICSHAHLSLVLNQAIALMPYFTVRHTCKCHEKELSGDDTSNPAGLWQHWHSKLLAKW